VGHDSARTTRPASGDNKVLAGLTATLSAELEGIVAHELVADIVRGVLDENRQHARDQTVESTMLEARQRLERIIRTHPERYSKNRPAAVR
jgi:hypothetical protein